MPNSAIRAQQMTTALWDSRHSPPDTRTADVPADHPELHALLISGRQVLIDRFARTALSAARRSAGSAARYWATVEAVMLATIPR